MPETPQDMVDILSYQQNTLSLENHISNSQYSKHIHKKQNADTERLLRKDYQSRNLHNTQTVPPIHQNNHVIQTDTTEKLYQTQSDTLAFNKKSLGRQLKLKATTCVPYECLTQTDSKLKLHPETLHNSSNGSAICNQWESLVDTSHESSAHDVFLWDHG